MSTEEQVFCKEGCTLMHAHDVCRVPAIPADQLDEFWRRVYPDGMDAQEILNELSDLQMMIENVSKVYDHVTGGKASKPNTDADVIKSLHDDYVNELVEEALADREEEQSDDEEALRRG
jgi:hypothetical protein